MSAVRKMGKIFLQIYPATSPPLSGERVILIGEETDPSNDQQMLADCGYWDDFTCAWIRETTDMRAHYWARFP
ncbi:MAG: hypothetical protein NUV34_00970 [Sulfuricaulis sp.]|nr:hypothetical protein [Sulfuricaulis sp.]